MAKTTKKELINRWLTPGGSEKRDKIIAALASNQPLDELGFVEKIDTRYDLRGIAFDYKSEFNNVRLSDIDFSYANFNHMLLQDSRVERVIFDEIDGTELSMYNCFFTHCRFFKADLNHAGFGINGGRYEHIVFEKAKFKHAMFFRPIFKDCSFLECKLDGVDFDSTHFIQVKFTGKLDDVWFRGIDPYRFKTEEEREAHGLNPMIVDFSEAVLWDMTISDHCDLSKVILPTDGNHFLIRNWWRVLESLEEIIDREFMNEDEQKLVHRFVRVSKVHAQTQDMKILNVTNIAHNAKDDLGERSEAYSKKLISLILDINDKLMRN